MKALYRVLLVSISLVIVCCIGTTVISPEDKAAIETVSVNDEVSISFPFEYKGEGAGLSALDLAGALYKGEAPKTKEQKILAFMESNNINVKEIVRNEFIQQAKQAPFLKGKYVEHGGSANFSIEIYMHGLIGAITHYSDVRPYLNIKVTLTDANKKVIWQQIGAVVDPNPNEYTPVKEYFENPELLQTAFHKAAKVSVTTALSKL